MAFTKATFDYLDSGGLINWQTTAKTAAFTAVSGEGYLVDTSSAAITVTLPASPSAGDEIIIVDYASNAGTNNITLGRNSLKIRGGTDDLVLENDNQTARLLYSGATKGWLVTTEAGAAAALPDLTVSYLVVAGGGGGGTTTANGNGTGGGGAGGYRTNYGGIALNLLASTDYAVTVGAGGAGGSTNTDGSNGSNSVFSDITSSGGGGGSGPINSNGNSGGSGGGGSAYSGSGGAGNSGSYTPVEGYAGGSGTPSGNTNYRGGGGGGASESGISGVTSGDGGDGLTNSITGSPVDYAGGGGGGAYTGVAGGSGGSGVGGNGGSGTGNGGNGSNNTGGGAGGGGWLSSSFGSGGTGGSGIVIVRYPDAYTITETTSPTVLTFTTDESISGEKVTTFTSGENGTIQFST